VIVRWLPGDGGTADERHRAEALLERSHGRLVAPTVFVTEVLGRISGRTKASGALKIDAQAAKRAAARVWVLDIELFAPEPRQDTARLLALGKNLSIADAAYVLLADRLESTLYTFDRKLIDGTQKLGLGELAALP
jgi:predicted nucleic acid-binding protein